MTVSDFKVCPLCAASIAVRSNYCPYCGEPQKSGQPPSADGIFKGWCIKCKEYRNVRIKNPKDTTYFCHRCGTSLGKFEKNYYL